MKIKKIIMSVVATSFLATSTISAASFDSETKATISEGLNNFAGTLLFVVPEASTQQNVWSDAYIGNLYPSIFPHFGFGLTLGGTYMDTSGLKTAVNALMGEQNFIKDALTGTDNATEYAQKILDNLKIGEIPEHFVMPTATLDVRLGGIVLPFDLGICAMMTNPAIFNINLQNPASVSSMSQALNFKNFGGFDGFIDYFTLGGDIRYRFFEGSTFVPVISIGGGYTFTMGNFKVGTTTTEEVSASGKTGNQTTNADMALGFQTHVIFAQIQISKEFKAASIFLGGRGVLSNTTTTWAWNYKTSNSNEELSSLNAEESDSGTLTAENASSSYHDGIWDMTKIQPQLYAGFSLNLWKVQLTFGACTDMRSFFDKVNYSDFIWSGYFSTHVKF